MNVYNITYAPAVKTVHLFFWGCNLNCRACVRKKEVYDMHLAETKEWIFNATMGVPRPPECFLELEEVMPDFGRV